MTERQLIEEFVLINTVYNPKVIFNHGKLGFGKWEIRVDPDWVRVKLFRADSYTGTPPKFYDFYIKNINEISVIDLQGYLALRILYGQFRIRLYFDGEHEIYFK